MASPWVSAFRRAERTVAQPLERWVQSELAVDALIYVTGLQNDLRRQAGRAMTAYLHLWNLPSLTDVRRLSRQMAYLERRVREQDRKAVDG
jgi:hypothetical protein